MGIHRHSLRRVESALQIVRHGEHGHAELHRRFCLHFHDAAVEVARQKPLLRFLGDDRAFPRLEGHIQRRLADRHHFTEGQGLPDVT